MVFQKGHIPPKKKKKMEEESVAKAAVETKPIEPVKSSIAPIPATPPKLTTLSPVPAWNPDWVGNKTRTIQDTKEMPKVVATPKPEPEKVIIPIEKPESKSELQSEQKDEPPSLSSPPSKEQLDYLNGIDVPDEETNDDVHWTAKRLRLLMPKR